MLMNYLAKYKLLYQYIMDCSYNSIVPEFQYDILDDIELQKTIKIVTINVITKRKCLVIRPIERTPRNN
jgi:hypothetical protein